MGGYWKNLDSRNYVGGNTVLLPLAGLPPKHRVRSIMLTFSLSGTKASGDTAGDLIPQLVQNLKLRQYFNLPGLETFRLRHMMNGRVVDNDPSIAANGIASGSTTFSIVFTLEIPFRDPLGGGTDDGSIPTEQLADFSVECTFAAANVLGGSGPITVTSGVVRSAVELIHETNVPELLTMGYIDQASQTMRLPPGIYEYLFLVYPNGNTLSSTDIATFDLIADGNAIMQNMRIDQVVSAWNREAATSPTIASGARGELSSGAAIFVPLVWRDKYGRSNLTKQMAAEKDVLFQITAGSITTGRLVFRRAQLKDKQTIVELGRQTGAPDSSVVYEPATGSKTPLHAVDPTKPPTRKVRLAYSALPGKFREAPTPGNKAAT